MINAIGGRARDIIHVGLTKELADMSIEQGVYSRTLGVRLFKLSKNSTSLMDFCYPWALSRLS